MRLLSPPPDPGGPTSSEVVDLVAAYAASDRQPPDDRPWMMLNMIASVDGATVIDGRSGGLGGPGDRAIFRVLRTIADVILVGAATVRAEGYGPPKKSGQQVAVVSRSGSLDWSSALFTSGAGVAVLPVDGPDLPAPTIRAIRAGQGDVDLRAALAQLEARIVLCEGGPTLNGQLLAAGLVDELCLTVAPRLVGGDAKRIVAGPEAPTDLRLAQLLEEDGFLFYRYVRAS
jgi:riboflavin biosynthesis pyrimidine reductase